MEQIPLDDCSKVTEGAMLIRNSKDVVGMPVLASTGLFHCPQCSQGFKQRSNAQSHFKSVHLNVKSQCLQCGKHFKKLKAHIQDVHSEKKMVVCKICGKEYQEGRLFKDHINKTHFQDTNGNPHEKYLITTECDVCGKVVLKSRFERHMRMKHYIPSNHVVECPICGVQVKYLPWHLQKFHKDMEYSKTMKKCEQCDQWFVRSEDLANHLVDHEKYFCFDCLLNFDSHLKLAKHMYTEHKKVFNIGKKLHRKWDKTCSSTVTYHIEKTSDQDPLQLKNTSRLQEHVGSEFSLSQGGWIQDQSIMDNGLLETLEEESFTVVLDEQGNLQNVILDLKEEVNAGQNDAIKKDIYNKPVSDNSGQVGYSFHIPDETLEIIERGESDDDVPGSKIMQEESKVTEYGNDYVEAAGNTRTFEIILPSENFKTYKNLLSGKGNLVTSSNISEETVKNPKLHERFVSSKEVLPKSLNGVQLSPEDEEVLNKAPSLEHFSSKDLLKYQIGRNEDDENNTNKYQACPSRQAHLCPYCRKVLKTRHSLNMHISVVHLEEKKFSCDTCHKFFATKADLVKHQTASHELAGQEMVKCDICKESFKASYLKRHTYYKHPSNSLPKHCSECGKEFKSREIMLKHVKKIHSKHL